jgi:ATP-binding protein involved in chromosome partitioning
MFQLESINIPVLGLMRNMSYFTPAELPETNITYLEKRAARKLAKD